MAAKLSHISKGHLLCSLSSEEPLSSIHCLYNWVIVSFQSAFSRVLNVSQAMMNMQWIQTFSGEAQSGDTLPNTLMLTGEKPNCEGKGVNVANWQLLKRTNVTKL